MITEIDVPKPALGILDEAREDFRNNGGVNLWHCALIERDDESFLPWAKQPYACTIFNLHTVHNPKGFNVHRPPFGGSLIWRTSRARTTDVPSLCHSKPVETCYPQFAEFLRLKKKYDLMSVSSDWYRLTKHVR